MDAETLTFPVEHWSTNPTTPNWQSYVEHWESKLRASIATEPDPAKRFAMWLTDIETQKHTRFDNRGVRLVFVEQPWLGFAESVERIIKATDASTRQQIAYEITSDDTR